MYKSQLDLSLAVAFYRNKNFKPSLTKELIPKYANNPPHQSIRHSSLSQRTKSTHAFLEYLVLQITIFIHLTKDI